MNWEAKLCIGLRVLGWQELPEKRGKYRVFSNRKETLLFVGSSGALRAGRCASDSFSIGCPAHQSGRFKAVIAAYETSDEAIRARPITEKFVDY